MGIPKPKWSNKTKKIAALAVMAPVLYVLGAYSHNVVLNLTDSVYFHFAYYQDAPIEKGDYVEFEFSHPIVRDGEQVRLTKRVACVSGERVTTINRDVFCDDRFIGEAYRETKKGKPLEVFTLNDTIPEGMVFLSGDTEHSFDSRYWGLIEVAKLNRVVPIW